MVAHVTVPDITPRQQWAVGGTPTSVFAFSFTFFSNSDIKVYNGSTLLTETTHYTLAGTAGADAGYPGGTVTLVTPVTNTTITVVRDLPIERTTDFPTAGPFNRRTLNTTLDKMVAMLSQLEELIGRGIALDITSTYWDALSKKISNLATPTSANDATTKSYVDSAVSGVATYAAAAAASAAAAATSETNAAASFDSCDARYLGAQAADPSVDHDGNALLTGALYWNTASNLFKTWTGSAWSALVTGITQISGAGLVTVTNPNGPTTTITVSIAAQTADASPALSDPMVFYKTASTAYRKITFQQVFDLLNTLTEDTTPDTANDFVLSYDASASAAKKAKMANIVGMPRGYLAGLQLANNGTDPTNDIDIAVGAARDGANSADMVLASALTKQLDAAWAVGNNAGGLDTGAVGNNTYHVWLIKRADTGVVDALFSLSASSPTMPANYTLKRRIGSIVRTGAAIKAFSQQGDEFLWNAAVLDVNQTNPGTAAVLRTLTIPTGIKVLARVRASVYFAAAVGQRPALLLTSPDESDQAPSSTAAPWNEGNYFSDTDSSQPATVREIRTNTSGQIRSRQTTSDGNTKFALATYGWVDRRGRDD